jgi:outer membrane protein
MKHATLALITLLASAAGAGAQTSAAPSRALSLPLSLNDAIALGLEHNRTVANASMQVDKAEQDIAVARTRRLPSFKIEAQGSQLLRPINLTFARGAFGEFAGIGPVPATDTNITTPARLNFVVTAEAQQPLTQLIKLNLNVRLNEAAREYERERVRDARLELVDEIRRLYYSIAQSRSALDASDHTLAMLRELDRLVTVRMAQQVALKGDGLTVQSRIAQTELTRLSLAHALASQKEQLNQMIGRDLRTPFEVVDIPDATLEEVDLEVAQSRATDARPDIRQARVKLQQAELARRVAKADYLPDVGLAVSYISPINIDGAPRQIATAAIQASWEPWDWGRKGRAVASKDLDIRHARNLVHETEERAVLDINSRFRKLEEARAQVRAARIGQDSARENARVRVTQYEVQAALLSDVLQTQATMADSNSQYQQALTAFWSARADFERALGEEVR